MNLPNNDQRRVIFIRQQSPAQQRVVNVANTAFVAVPATVSVQYLAPVIVGPARQQICNVRRQRQVNLTTTPLPTSSIRTSAPSTTGAVLSMGSPVNSRKTQNLARRPMNTFRNIVCLNCGIVSLNPLKCDRCKKVISAKSRTDQAIEDGLIATRREIQQSSSKGLSSSSFYGNHHENDINRYIRASAAGSATLRQQIRKRPLLTKQNKTAEPDCITISSDSEDETPTLTEASISKPSSSSPVLQSRSRSSAAPCPEKIDVENCETPKKRMKIGSDSCDSSTISDTSSKSFEIVSNSPQSSETKPDEDLVKSTLKITVDAARIGQEKLKPMAALQISQDSLKIVVHCVHLNQDAILDVKWSNVMFCDLCYDSRGPCIYVTMTPGSLPQLREQLGMEKGKFPYYDVDGGADQKLFIFYFNAAFISSSAQGCLTTLARKIELVRKKLKKPSNFFNRISYPESERRQNLAAAAMIEREEAAGQLRQAVAGQRGEISQPTKPSRINTTGSATQSPAGAVTRNKEIKVLQSGIAEEHHHVFSGPRVELFIFPPSPAKGGISVTNADQFCLKEGEFLNDVIIDFYLQYVFTRIISLEQRERSHRFSCFFYARLMQKSKKNKDISPAERRHGQVKKWTRNVDIFSKDFIFVPINEASHWYLAVICFPGLKCETVELFRADGSTEKHLYNHENAADESVIPKSMEYLTQYGLEDEEVEGQRQSEQSLPEIKGQNRIQVPECSADKDTSEGKVKGHLSDQDLALQKLVSVQIPSFRVLKYVQKAKHLEKTTKKSGFNSNTDGKPKIKNNSAKITKELGSTKQTGRNTPRNAEKTQSSPKIETEMTHTRITAVDMMEVIPPCGESDCETIPTGTKVVKSLCEQWNDADIGVEKSLDSTRTKTAVHLPLGVTADDAICPPDVASVKSDLEVGSISDDLFSETESAEVPSNQADCDNTDSKIHGSLGSLRKSETYEIYISPQFSSSDLSQDLKTKSTISPRKPVVVVPKVANRSPVRIKSEALSHCSTPKSSSLVPSSDESVTEMSSSAVSDVESTRGSPPRKKKATPSDRISKALSFDMSRLFETNNTDERSSHRLIETSSHDLSLSPSDANSEARSSRTVALRSPLGGAVSVLDESCSSLPNMSTEATVTSTILDSPPTRSNCLEGRDVVQHSPCKDSSLATLSFVSNINCDRDVHRVNSTASIQISAAKTDDAVCASQNTSSALSLSKLKDSVVDSGRCLTAPEDSHHSIYPGDDKYHISDEDKISEAENSDGNILSRNFDGLVIQSNCESASLDHAFSTTVIRKVSVDASDAGRCDALNQSRGQGGDFKNTLKPNPPGLPEKQDVERGGDKTDDFGGATQTQKLQVTKKFKRPCILIFDSLRGPSRSKVATSLREYLSMEWKTRKEETLGSRVFDKNTMRMCSVVVPQQDNYTDCGLFLLHYVEKFFTNPIQNFSLPIRELETWFDPAECKQKRGDINKVIDDLHKEWVAKKLGKS